MADLYSYWGTFKHLVLPSSVSAQKSIGLIAPTDVIVDVLVD